MASNSSGATGRRLRWRSRPVHTAVRKDANVRWSSKGKFLSVEAIESHRERILEAKRKRESEGCPGLQRPFARESADAD